MTVSDYTIPMAVPAPLRLIQLADLHGRPPAGLWKKVSALRPELLLCTGDTLHHPFGRERERGLACLREAVRIAPVFCSLGNHETACFPAERAALCQEIRENGAVLLDNEAVFTHGLWIGGLSSPYTLDAEGNPCFAEPDAAFLSGFAAASGEKLLLCHHPELYPPYIRPLSVRLTLAGHAHGGQWRFRGQGLYAPGQGLFPALTGGLHEQRLLISRGLGNPCHIPRLGNPPELCVITLLPEGRPPRRSSPPAAAAGQDAVQSSRR